MIRMRACAAALALPLAMVHQGCAQQTVAEQYAGALTYRQFVASDAGRSAEWTRAYENAKATVDAALPRARAFPGHWHLFVVAESWCSDAMASVPYLARLADEDSALDLRLLRRADAQAMLQSHLFKGRAATPLVVLYDDQFVERGVWIERPAALRAFIAERSGKLDDDGLSGAIREWRAKDAGRSVLVEILSLLEPRSCREGGDDCTP
ncbi:MAG TPA: thioredoxin family protein [Gemmatimonadaceae bacterium]|nr:thioredoxin family protein [Gemmatimonadaceae bacterium]